MSCNVQQKKMTNTIVQINQMNDLLTGIKRAKMKKETKKTEKMREWNSAKSNIITNSRW